MTFTVDGGSSAVHSCDPVTPPAPSDLAAKLKAHFGLGGFRRGRDVILLRCGGKRILDAGRSAAGETGRKGSSQHQRESGSTEWAHSRTDRSGSVPSSRGDDECSEGFEEMAAG